MEDTTTTALADAEAVRSRRGSRTVKKLWYRLRDRPAADRALIAGALRESLAGEAAPGAAAVTWHAAVFQSFVTDTGSSGENAYRLWWRGHPDRDDLPSADDFRKMFGGPKRRWSVAREALGVGFSSKVTALRLLKPHAEATLPEVVAAASFWASIAPRPLRVDPFIQWCADQSDARLRVYDGWARITTRAVYRHFGAWADLLEHIGEQEEATRSRLDTKPRDALPVETLLDLLRGAHRDLPGVRVGQTAIDGWIARGEAPELQQLGDRRVSAAIIKTRFGSLGRALYQADVIDLAEFARRVRGAEEMTTEEMTASLAAFLAKHGPRGPGRTYKHWRRGVIKAAAAEGRLLVVPQLDAVVRCIGDGSWDLARIRTSEWMRAGGQPSEGVYRDALAVPVT